MTILVASDSFKDGCTSYEACIALAKGIESVSKETSLEICPISDGGEGAVDVLQLHLGGELIETEVSNPLFKRIKAHYLITEDGIAFIEMAKASGLELLSPIERNPLNTSTFGTGEMILDAMNRGCKEIIIAVGGSATNDLGMGMSSALSCQFEDISGNPLSPIGYNLANVSKIDSRNLDKRLSDIKFSVIADVHNPLYGPSGAAHIFARQKGASSDAIDRLDDGLRHLASIIQNNLQKDIAHIPGAGAAGGLGAGCVAFLDAEISSGFDTFSSLIGLESKVQKADIIITGEGHLDNQTKKGKVISGICRLARKSSKRVVTFCGKNSISESEAKSIGISRVIAISDPQSEAELEFALAQTAYNLEEKAREWMLSSL